MYYWVKNILLKLILPILVTLKIWPLKNKKINIWLALHFYRTALYLDNGF